MADTIISPTQGRISGGKPPQPPTAGIGAQIRSATIKWSEKSVITLIDQGLISGSNFLISIFLARQLPPHEYGAYSLAFEVFLFLTVIYGALMLEPMSVFGSSVYRDSLSEYLASLLKTHIAVGVLILAVFGAAGWAFHAFAPGNGLASALVGLGITSPCVLLFWLVRRVFYVRNDPRNAVLGGFAYFAVLMAGVLIVSRVGLLSPVVAFLLMAGGAIAGSMAMLARSDLPLEFRSGRVHFWEAVKLHWGYGRWAIASSGMLWFSTALCYPLLATFHGLADTGALKALMNLNSPIGQVFSSLSLLFLPYAARVHHHDGLKGSQRLLWKYSALYTGGTLLYWVVILAFREPLVHHLYAGNYSGIAMLLPWIALGSILRISATAQAIMLRAMNSPALLFYAYSISGVATLVIGIPCIWAFGLHGAVITFVISGAIAFILSLASVQYRSPLAMTAREGQKTSAFAPTEGAEQRN